MTVMAPTTAQHRIVIVEGQEFSVPVETTTEQIRSHLATNFPNVASASVQYGKRVIDGIEHQTVEFVKKAGTKGLDGNELAALLAGVPAAQVTLQQHEAVIDQLLFGQLTFEEALHPSVAHAVDAVLAFDIHPGATVCRLLDTLAPVATAPRGW